MICLTRSHVEWLLAVRPSPNEGSSAMARKKIQKKDGTATPYFWSDKDGEDRTHQTVYKQTTDGVKRMKGVHYDAVKNRMNKD